MSDAPERIWINGAMAMGVSGKGWPEYVRADLYEQRGERIAELQAEVERLREQFTCVWDHNTVTEKYPCGRCGYPSGLEDARRIPPQPQENRE